MITAPRLHQVLVSSKIGGGAIVAMHLAAAIRRRGRPVYAWVPGKGAASDALERGGFPWRTYDFNAMRGSRAAQLLACGRMLPGLAAFVRPIVHVHDPVFFRLMRPALLAARARTVVHFHIEPTVDEIEWTMQSPPDRIVGCAEYIAAQVRNVLGERVSPEQVCAAPNGIDLSQYGPLPAPELERRSRMPDRRFVVLMMANLARHKGQITAIRAVRRLKERGIPVECWLAGEDREDGRRFEAELHALVSELSLEQDVRFLGYRSDGPALFHAADAFLLPSTHEGLPLSILEAQASGVPVVGAPIPGILEVVADGRTGFVVAADDDRGYADRLEQIFTNRSLREGLVAEASAHVTRYSLQAFEHRMLAVFEGLSPGLLMAPGTDQTGPSSSGGTVRPKI